MSEAEELASFIVAEMARSWFNALTELSSEEFDAYKQVAKDLREVSKEEVQPWLN